MASSTPPVGVVSDPMSRRVTWRPAEVLYVVGVGLMTAALLGLADLSLLPPAALLAIALPLGPLGVVVLVFGVLASIVVVVSDIYAALIADIVTVIAVTVTAVVNVRAVRAIRAASGTRPPQYRSRVSVEWDRLIGSAVFGLVAELFVLLCVLAGFTAFLAHGVDVQIPEDRAARTIAIAGTAWAVGTVVAVGGLVLWIVQWRRGRPILRWAVADVVLVLAGGIFLIATVG